MNLMTTCFAAALILASAPAVFADGISSSLVPSGEEPQDASGAFVTTGDGCTLVTFEGLGNGDQVPPVAGDVSVTFGTSWLSLIDADAGGTGNFANEPTPETVAFYLNTSDISVNLVPAVQFVEFFYVASATSVPVTLTAFDAADQVVDTALGSTVGTSTDGASCVGDPNGTFCLWDTITLTSATDDIVRVEITGSTANQIGFDNMQFCREAEVVGACCLPTGLCSETSEASCAASGGLFLPGTPCDPDPCDPISIEPNSWGRVKAQFR